ncbi:MAG: hypothetical protein R6U10_02575 [Thermoplasmatota archaeon]
MAHRGNRLVACIVIGLFLCAGVMSVAGRRETDTWQASRTCEQQQKFEAFNKTYFVFGKRSVEETFYMENGTMVIGFGFLKAGRYFTGQGHIELHDEEEPDYYGAADTCTYLLGVIILPWDSWIEEARFTPGQQTLKLDMWGFGRVTVIIYGQR